MGIEKVGCGIVDSVDTSSRKAFIRTEGRNEPDKLGYRYEKGNPPSLGDMVMYGTLDGGRVIIQTYEGSE